MMDLIPRPSRTRTTLLRSLLAATIGVCAAGCERGEMQRPYGYLRLGPVSQFVESEVYLPEQRIVVRRDQLGLSAMSTMCTYDLSPLSRKSSENGGQWVSSYSTSAYDTLGKVISGPAKADLPYYNLKFDAGRYGGVVDTLYVEVGAVRDRNWRLPFSVSVATPTAATKLTAVTTPQMASE